MTRYIALLRGINISGKNKIPMPALKEYFFALGYAEVRTHLNSGNVIFSTDEDEKAASEKIGAMIKEKFALDIPLFVIRQERLSELLHNAPEWWGSDDTEIYDNLIFVLPSSSAQAVAEKIGEPTKELERIFVHEDVIFWSFDRKRYAKAAWWKKTATSGIAELLTIRTANTVRKIAEM